MKLPALTVSALALLLVIIGLMLPLWTAEYKISSTALTVELYIKKQKIAYSGTTQTVDIWDCNEDCEIPDSHKAGFAMLFIGMLANLACLVSLAAANDFVKLPAPMGQKQPTVRLAVVSAIFYFIGTVVAVNAAPKNAKGELKDNLAIGIGSILIIIGLVSAVATAALSFMGFKDSSFNMEPAGATVGRV